MKILFVCTGNTCRSSMAAALAREILESGGAKSDVEIFSAGVAAWPGDCASQEAVEAMAELGISLLEHRASRLEPKAVLEADLVLTMTGFHRDYVRNLVPQASDKVFTLAEYAQDRGDVPDPAGQSLRTYRDCALRLKNLVASVLDRLTGQDF